MEIPSAGILFTAIIGVVTCLAGVVALLFRLVMTGKDAAISDLRLEITDLKSKQKSYQEVADEALKSARETANYYRAKYEKLPPIMPLAPVISESHSPSTAKQREEAAIATMRAGMAQIKLATGQEPREEPEHAKE